MRLSNYSRELEQALCALSCAPLLALSLLLFASSLPLFALSLLPLAFLSLPHMHD